VSVLFKLLNYWTQHDIVVAVTIHQVLIYTLSHNIYTKSYFVIVLSAYRCEVINVADWVTETCNKKLSGPRHQESSGVEPQSSARCSTHSPAHWVCWPAHTRQTDHFHWPVQVQLLDSVVTSYYTIMARESMNMAIYFPKSHENIPKGAAWGNIMTWETFPCHNCFVTHL